MPNSVCPARAVSLPPRAGCDGPHDSVSNWSSSVAVEIINICVFISVLYVGPPSWLRGRLSSEGVAKPVIARWLVVRHMTSVWKG